MFFFSSKPVYSGQEFERYETEMQIWALELSLLLRQTESKCERNCKCCTDLTSLVPTSFVDEFRHANGGHYENVRFKQSHFRTLCKQLQDCRRNEESIKHLVDRMLSIKRIANTARTEAPQAILISEVTTEEVKREAYLPEHMGEKEPRECKHISAERMWLTAHQLV